MISQFDFLSCARSFFHDLVGVVLKRGAGITKQMNETNLLNKRWRSFVVITHCTFIKQSDRSFC